MMALAQGRFLGSGCPPAAFQVVSCWFVGPLGASWATRSGYVVKDSASCAGEGPTHMGPVIAARGQTREGSASPARGQWYRMPWRFVATARELAHLLGAGLGAAKRRAGRAHPPDGERSPHEPSMVLPMVLRQATLHVGMRRGLQQCGTRMSACWVLCVCSAPLVCSRAPSGVPL